MIVWSLFSVVIAVGSCGTLRYLTNASVSASFLCAVGAGVLVYVFGRSRAYAVESLGRRGGVYAAFFSASWIAILLLTVATKGRTGLYTLYSQDVATHMASIGEFAYKQGDIYNGFVALYGLISSLITVFQVDVIDALSISIYGMLSLSLVLVAVAIVTACAAVLRGWGQWVTLFVTSTTAFVCVWNPLVFYNIGEGFWAHLTSILVLCLLWGSYTTISHPVARIGIALYSVVMYRFSYGLNLPDLLTTLSIILFAEAQTLSKMRFPMRCVSVALLAGGVVCYQKIMPLFSLNGGILPIYIPQSLEAAVVISLALAVALLTARGERPHQALVRFLVFPMVFALVSVVAESVFRQQGFPERYYSYKYGMHRALLLSFAAPVVVTWMIFKVRQTFREKRLSALAFACSIALTVYGVNELYKCYRGYALGKGLLLNSGDQAYSDPLYSDTLVTAIRGVLAERGSEYHGTLAKTWGGVLFLNAYMMHEELGRKASDVAYEFTTNGLSEPPESKCAFWLRKGLFRNKPLIPVNELRASIASFETRKDKTCLKQKNSDGRRFILCYICGGDKAISEWRMP